MRLSAEHYLSRDVAAQLRAQARVVWAVCLAVSALWLAATVAPVVFAAAGNPAAGASFFEFLGYICHQIPGRSFFAFETQFGVCHRCFGVYFGLAAGTLVYPIWRRTDNIEPLSRVWLFLGVVPITVDWSLTVFGIWQNTAASRFITGTILGVACATYIIPAAVEIVRHLTFPHRRRTA